MEFKMNEKAVSNLRSMNRPTPFNERTEFRFVNWVGYQQIAEGKFYMNILLSNGPKIGLPDAARKQHQELIEAAYAFGVPIIIFEDQPTALNWKDADGNLVEGKRRNFVVTLPDKVDKEELLAAYREAMAEE